MPIANQGSKLFICATPQNEDLTVAEFAALTWVEICCPNGAPSWSMAYAVLTATCLSGKKHTRKGAQEESTFEIPVYYEEDCVAQDILRESIEGNDYFAYKLERSDGSATQTPTILYCRAMTTATTFGLNGGVDEWTEDGVTCSIQQGPIMVKPVPIP